MLSEMSLLECWEMPFKDSSVWSLLGLCSLLLLLLLPLLVLLFPRRRLMSLGDKIKQKIRRLSKWQLREETNNDPNNEPKKARKSSSYFGYTAHQLIPKVDVPETKDLFQGIESPQKGDLVRAGLLRPDLHGMDIHEITVLEFLERGTSSLLGISGMRGVGKTTLLRLVRTTYIHDDSFDYIFYTGAGVGCTVGSLQGVLARNIGFGLLPQTSNVPVVKVISSFLKDKTFLLLLDDVRERIDLAAIGLPVPLGHR
uniref:NB-ARC domain-containing protein n=1 Tax=Arundo donax TaxID=35708 RepID=A0A0A9FC02_ARUDO